LNSSLNLCKFTQKIIEFVRKALIESCGDLRGQFDNKRLLSRHIKIRVEFVLLALPSLSSRVAKVELESEVYHIRVPLQNEVNEVVGLYILGAS